MNTRKVLFFQILVCISCAAFTLYGLIDRQNELTELRLAIPSLKKEVERIEKDNIRLSYEIDRFESPIHLMELQRKPEFGHLHYPYKNDIVVLEEPQPLQD
ncbi:MULTISPECIES: hypothetical protein [Parachlamydia]|jgi:hypothetical protein|uniref:Cell division protein FtsL n=2 Tax=Parachlamydia acanthamoebae TaxID=83552 RepID=F8L0Z5_PARAV|nr:hypothetical protein [Parachlamydia acanthamoebae]CCB86912.1 putative uncharacterized protein [Parachlamydia acanthamoebae UV-7]